MKPFQTLLFLMSVFLALFLLSWVFPEEGIKIGENIRLKFAKPRDLKPSDTTVYADITSIVESSNIPFQDPVADSLFNTLEDTSSVVSDYKFSEALLESSDSLISVRCRLEFPADNPESLYPFFSKLKGVKGKDRRIRILHYGDSQIEADRMSSYIRNRFQVGFSGSGCGTVPAVPLYNGQLSIKQEHSENWIRYTGFANIDSTLGHNSYGALMSFVRYSGDPQNNPKNNKAWLNFKKSSLAYPAAREFSDVSLYYTTEQGNVKIVLSTDAGFSDSIFCEPAKTIRKKTWKFENTPQDLSFTFSGSGDINVYGVSLDHKKGVALDNIPLRGSSGLIFSKTDTAFLGQMYRMMDVGLIILQFGGNVVPYMKDNFGAYEKYFRRELNILKKILPEVPVIVIGPSDMSIKEKDKYITYPNLEGIRDALKSACLGSGYIFWDMYNAMGGRNSMPSWVAADPPLAVPDYVHFNTRGARIIAEMFTNALMFEYNTWVTADDPSK